MLASRLCCALQSCASVCSRVSVTAARLRAHTGSRLLAPAIGAGAAVTQLRGLITPATAPLSLSLRLAVSIFMAAESKKGAKLLKANKPAKATSH